MSATEDYRATVRELLDLQLRGGQRILDEFMAANSNLPGPAGNFRLVAAVVAALKERMDTDGERVWSLLGEWASIPVEQAPPNDPREMLPHSAAVGHGAIAAMLPAYWERALARLRDQARDRRWRTREGVAMGLQQMARSSYDPVFQELERWVRHGDLLEMRAAAAALAEPDLVKPAARALAALALHGDILERLRQVPGAARKSAEFQALRKGLGYTLSVVGTGAPEHAFARMREWAAWQDRDVRWLLKQNLGKGRLTRSYPGEVAALVDLLDDKGAG